MPLVTLQTNLKSLKYGGDRPGVGNSSNQPYVTTPIPENGEPIPAELGLPSPDYLLRGGLNAARDTAKDLVRLSKYFADLKSPAGALFATKQQVLSRIGVATQASGNQSTKDQWKNATLNEGVYNPLSTLAQAGVVAFGGHLDKQGLIPGVGIRTYSDVVKGEGVLGDSIVEVKRNRLVNLYNTQVANPENDFTIEDSVNLYSYKGGPNSILGIGKTNIKFATDNRGAYTPTGANDLSYQNGLQYNRFSLTSPPLGVSNKWFDLVLPINENSAVNSLPDLSTSGGLTYTPPINSVYNIGTLNSSDTSKILGIGALTSKNFTTLTQQDLINLTDVGPESFEFRNFTRIPLQQVLNLPDNNPNKSSTIMSISPSYNIGNNKTIEGKSKSRIHQQSPGQKGNILNYTKGKIVDGNRVVVVDQINAQPIYKSSNVRENVAKNDLVKFRIAAIDTENPNSKQFIHFRAFIDSFSDSYNANWTGQKYMGRGEQFYKYDSFTRDINLSFTAIAQSKPEIMEMYRKLNFLASNLAPDYTTAGYMAGPLVQLTMGGWCYELPGFLRSINLDIPQETTWEIGIDEQGNFDNTVKEMPHMVKVTGFSFTPIHRFRPAKQKITHTKNGNRYGDERYLSLSTAVEGKKYNNYDNIEQYKTI